MLGAEADRMQAAYHQASPKTFTKELAGLGLGEEQVSITHNRAVWLVLTRRQQALAFGKLWSAKGADYVEKLRNKPFFPRSVSAMKFRSSMSQVQLYGTSAILCS